MIKWAEENGYSWDRYECIRAAARGGHLEVMKWLRHTDLTEIPPWTLSYLWDEDVCANAAKSGNLDLMRWLRDNGCPWDEDVCANAAGNGSLDFLIKMYGV